MAAILLTIKKFDNCRYVRDIFTLQNPEVNLVKMRSMIQRCFCLCFVFVALSFLPALAQQRSEVPTSDPLIETLQANGVLTVEDVAKIKQAKSAQEAHKRLEDILLSKGVITKEQYSQILAHEGQSEPSQSAVLTPVQPQATAKEPMFLPASLGSMEPPNPTEPGAPPVVEREPTEKVNAALAPIRVFPVGGIERGKMRPAFKADGLGITPYGFIKATAIEDSSSPNGDDFPLPGFLTDTAPNGSPEFHIKGRSTRFGSNFEWLDINPKWTITGKIEADFEGNFNRSDNRNLSSVRSSNPSLRLAYGRLDYKFNEHNTFSALFGQDWTIFGSSTLPNMLETTGLGIAFGTLYERDPQMRVGFTHKTHGISLMPEFSIDLPVSGIPPSNVADQLGFGERQGPDSNRPQYQVRLVAQWQLDHAPGVPPAQIIFSAFDGRRTANVLASAVPAGFTAAFPNGVSVGSKQDGWDAEWQLPTRWFTLIGKYYSGADLRWFFADQLYSFYNDTAGLTGTATAHAVDGNSDVVFGTNGSGQLVVAPQRPVRSVGGFAQIGFPLSRLFHANPAGRNAGWSIYGLYGIDQAKTRDLDKFGGNRRYSTMLVGTLNYKMNKWVSFSFEESLYTTHANPHEPLPLFKGFHSREWNDIREEGGPVFSF
jgi:hypothetical protein